MGNSSTYNVLIVASNLSAAKVVNDGLSAGGMKTHLVADASTAVQIIEKTSIEAILVHRPNEQLREYGIVARLRELSAAKHLPVIVCVDANVEVLARGAGDMLSISKFVQAPPDLTHLLQTISRCIEEQRVMSMNDEESDDSSGALNTSKLRGFHLRVAQMNHFERLEVSTDDGLIKIRDNFKRLATVYSAWNLEEKTRENQRMIRDIHHCLGEAYKVLKDPALRKKYERDLAGPKITYKTDDSLADELDDYEVYEGPEDEVGLEDEEWMDTSESPSSSVMEEPVTVSAPLVEQQAPAPAPVQPSVPEPEPEPVVAPTPEPEPVSEPESKLTTDFDSMTARFRDSDEGTSSTTASTPPKSSEPSPWEGGNQNVKESHDQLAAAAHLQAVIGDYAGAVELLRQCIRMKPDVTEYRYNLELNLGRNYKKMGNRPRAEQHFQEALKFAPAGNTAAKDELAAIQGGEASASKEGDSLGSTFSKLFGGKKS